MHDTDTDTMPLDVWLRLDDEDEDDIADAEANTFTDGNGYRVDWYLNSVGLVMSRHFTTYPEAEAWLIAEGFQDFTS